MADNIPDDLDDLLNSIRNEDDSSKESSALVVIPKEKKVDNKKTVTVKATVVSTDKFTKGKSSSKNTAQSAQKISQKSESNTLLIEKLSEINNNVKSALSFFQMSESLAEKRAEEERVAADRAVNQAKENKVERNKEKKEISAGLKSAVEPVKNVFDSIFDIFKRFAFIALLNEIVAFLKDPIKYLQKGIDVANNIIGKVEKGIDAIIKNAFVNPFNTFIGLLNKGIVELTNGINGLTSKVGLPELSLFQIPAIGEVPSIEGAIPRIPTAQSMADFVTGGGGSDQPQTAEGQAQTTQTGQPAQGSSADLKAAIRSAEAGGDYGAVFRRYLGGFSRRNEDITKMSIAEVVQYQKDYIAHQKALGIPQDKRSAAVGAYQMLYPDTAAKALGIPLSAKFDKKTQDALAEYYLNMAGQQEFKAGKITAEQYNDRLAGQFASLKTAKGVGVYDNDGLNRGYASVLDIIKRSVNQVQSPAPQPAKPPQAQVSAMKSPQQTPPAPPKKSATPTVMPVMGGGGGAGNNATSSSQASQKQIPVFSATDITNPVTLSIKSLYNIVA